MSKTFRLPLNHNIYNRSSSDNSSNKENRPNNNNNNISMNGNTFATPSEDDFDDDDDELLIAASQQVEKKIAKEKAEAAVTNVNNLQLQGEIAILRDQTLKLNREKDQLRLKQFDEIKNIEQKYKKDLENMRSKLEFKDRDIEELKSKLQATDNFSSRQDNVPSAKRPRLSVVKEQKHSKASSAPSQLNQQFRLRKFQTSSTVALTQFCSLNINEVESSSEVREFALFAQGLKNNPDIQNRFNIRPSLNKLPPSKEVTTTVARLLKRYESSKDWSERSLCLRILSELLAHNSFPAIEQEIKKMLGTFQKCSKEEHSLLSQTVRRSGVNVFSFCAGGSGSCMLSYLYRYKSKDVITLLIKSLLKVTSLPHCYCSDRMIAYICDLIGDTLQDAPCESSVFPGEVVGGDLSSSVLEIRDETLLIQCLQLLTSLSPYFPELKLSVTSQTLFYGSLGQLKKCNKLSMSGLAMVDVLYEAVFELNTSMN